MSGNKDMSNFVKEVLGQLWHKPLYDIKRPHRFDEIVGRDNIKQIFVKAILSKRPVHLLLVGSPGSAKTMFLTEIMRRYNKMSYFVVGSNTTKAGLVNQLFERKPKFVLIDELEKMSTVDQTSLLHLMETGIISETKINKTRQMELTSWVFATANSCERICKPLLSRFVVLQVPEYSYEEFNEIAISKHAKEKVDRHIATIIAQKAWNELGSRDFRDIIKVGRLANDSQQVSIVIDIIKKHRSDRFSKL